MTTEQHDREHGEFVERLLASADADAAPDGALERELGRMGLVVTAVAMGASASAGASAGAGASASASAGAGAGAGAWVGGGLAVKLGVVGAVTMVATSAWLAVREPEPVAKSWVAPSAQAVATASIPAAPATMATAVGAEEAKVPEQVELPAKAAAAAPVVVKRAGGASGGTGGAGGAESSAAAAPATLAAEIALVDRARSLAARSPNEALAVLEEHGRSYPRGELRDEAAVVRVEALLAAGRRDDARRLAEPFIRTRAGTPLARRMAALLEPSNPTIP